MNLRRRARHSTCWALLLVVGFTRAAAAQTEPRNVLLLYSYDREFGPHNAFAELFRPELSRSSLQPIDFIELSLQAAQLDRRVTDESMADYLASTISNRRLDLVVPIGGPAAVFAHKYRQRLFPATPMLFAAVDRRWVNNSTLGDRDAAVTIEHDPPQMVDNILQLLPETRTLFVVTGASPLEQFWLDQLKRELRRFEGRLKFIWTSEFSFAEMLKRCATLPPRSAIFYGILSLDANGVPQVDERTLHELHDTANAPLFGLYTTQLGRGIVGGPLLSLEHLSANSANAALRMLRGESGRSIAIPTQVAGAPIFDSRELRRWGIDEARLPPGSSVRFRELTVWQQYQRQIVAGAAFVALQCLLVTVLLVNLVTSRRAERSLRASVTELGLARAALSGLSRRLMLTHENESARIARDLRDNLCQRMTALTVRLRSLSDAPDAPAGDMREHLEDLYGRFAALTSEFSTVSDQVYAQLKLLGLPATASGMCQELASRHDTIIDFRHEGVPDDLSIDIALALFRVLQEAVGNAIMHAGVRRVSVSLRGDRDAIHLEVADEGVGFDPENAMKKDGLGLISMRERMRLVDGDCTIESRPGGGTRVRAHVPLRPRR